MIRRTKQLLIDYKVVFGSENGKRILEDLKKRCPLLTQSINTAHGVDVEKLLVEEGRRSVLLYIYKMIQADPNQEPAPLAQNDFA